MFMIGLDLENPYKVIFFPYKVIFWKKKKAVKLPSTQR